MPSFSWEKSQQEEEQFTLGNPVQILSKHCLFIELMANQYLETVSPDQRKQRQNQKQKQGVGDTSGENTGHHLLIL